MSEYDKELQTGTDEFEDATKPLRKERSAEAARDDQRERDEAKDDPDTRPA